MGSDTSSRGNEQRACQIDIDLLIQATQRQTAADSVYIAIPRPAKMTRNGRWRGIKRLLRRLELGLIIVTFKKEGADVRLVEHPIPAAKRRDGVSAAGSPLTARAHSLYRSISFPAQ